MILSEHRKEFILCTGTLLALAGGVIWLRTVTVRDTYQYVKQVKDFQDLQQEIQSLRIEWLKLTAPKRLEQLAKELDLHPPSRSQVLKYAAESAAPGRVTPRKGSN